MQLAPYRIGTADPFPVFKIFACPCHCYDIIWDCDPLFQQYDVAYHFQGSLLHLFMGISVEDYTQYKEFNKSFKLLLYTRVLSSIWIVPITDH